MKTSMIALTLFVLAAYLFLDSRIHFSKNFILVLMEFDIHVQNMWLVQLHYLYYIKIISENVVK